MTVYGYLRVSTDKQDCDNQKIGVEALAKRRGLVVDKWIEDDGVSGTKEPEKRALGGVLKKLKKDDVILCSELSRLGRKLFMIMRILEHAMTIGAHIFTEKENYELGDNVQSKVLAFAFGLVAELEREMISKRTKEALAAKKARGEKLGRALGAKNKIHKYDGFSLEKFERDYQKTYSLKYCLGKQNLSTSYFYGGGFNETLRAKIKEMIEKHNKDKPIGIYCVNTKHFQKNVLKAFGTTEIKPIVRLSDFKVYKSIRSLWYDNFSKELNPTIYNLKKLAESIESGDEFHGKFFENKDFYDGKTD
uniref:Integrase n=1 Tax=Myoviridae sp. ctwVB15 TaxID=2825208 RepID=A0A8S5UNF8_9CAUD|nr:MAG TPA: integrase [Myoviridae sp. ctwVB15]